MFELLIFLVLWYFLRCWPWFCLVEQFTMAAVSLSKLWLKGLFLRNICTLAFPFGIWSTARYLQGGGICPRPWQRQLDRYLFRFFLEG